MVVAKGCGECWEEVLESAGKGLGHRCFDNGSGDVDVPCCTGYTHLGDHVSLALE